MRWIDPGREIISVWINIVLDNVLLILKKPAVSGRLLIMVELRGVDNPLPAVAS